MPEKKLYQHTHNKHAFKAIALDLDGTLLNSNKQVSPNTARILQHINKEYGVEILLISGRAPRLIEPYADAVGVNCYVVGYNGAQGWSKKDEKGQRKLLFTDPVPTHHLSSIFDYVNERNLVLNVYLDYVYAIDRMDLRPFTDHYSKLTGAEYRYVPTYDKLIDTQPAKCIILTESNHLCDTLMAEATSHFPDLAVIKSNCHSHELSQWYVEFLRKGVDKGTALLKWCEAVQGWCSPSEVVAFGDAENDLNMLKVAKLGFCMAQGVQIVKEIAHYVTEYSNDDDGVVRELQKIYELNII
jgi:Cof subfamily protein (haloacid dehalogenase superfamily)